MPDQAPVIEISGRFRDAERARAVADALNPWFRWIVDGSFEPMPSVVDDLGVPSRDFSWALEEDVDWNLGPHARAVAEQVLLDVGPLGQTLPEGVEAVFRGLMRREHEHLLRPGEGDVVQPHPVEPRDPVLRLEGGPLVESSAWLGAIEPRAPLRGYDKCAWWLGGGDKQHSLVVNDPWSVVRRLGLELPPGGAP